MALHQRERIRGARGWRRNVGAASRHRSNDSTRSTAKSGSLPMRCGYPMSTYGVLIFDPVSSG
ncbi:hypothetical protein SAMN05443287_102585 [Micromonospora phaseoli]|uniref:Uncharacterized protein n=1 Tax=Micromonospora phaseoli TaxID=1144548 RepID=A0A1H6VAL7_9ACTN|nr:hypothetical protein [Micromonospora phaseoli]PZV93662.1 hypothetical protein CLV64_109121 [Micromonospora phaseoli]SEJ00856.1 hypothetical protein SAMN05443287_102585 [Micromonospora phaseoli]